jgi:hypothetical protein
MFFAEELCEEIESLKFRGKTNENEVKYRRNPH